MPSAENVKAHYDSLETEVLLDLWSRGGQLDWAERLLHGELVERGVPEVELERLAESRDARNVEIAEQNEMSQFGVMGRAITLFGGGMLAGLMASIFGQRAMYATVVVIGLIYGSLLIRFIAHLNKNLPEGPVSFIKVLRRVIELLFVLGIIIFGALRATAKV